MGLEATPPIRQARGTGETIVRSRAFEWFSRSGFVARGLIYGIIGVLAIKLSVGAGGKTTNQKGALETVAHQPFGKVLLILVAVSLAGYSSWRLVRAAIGHGPEQRDGVVERVAALASGVVYAGMCAIAVELLAGSGSSSSGSSGPRKAAAGAFGWPGGVWLVGAAGAVLIGVGLYQGYRGVTGDFLKDSKTKEMSRGVKRVVGALGVIGHLARMVVFGLVGSFLIKAAIEYKPRAAVGIDGALNKVAHASYGPLLLGIVAAGLIAFAAYSFSDARYRRI